MDWKTVKTKLLLRRPSATVSAAPSTSFSSSPASDDTKRLHLHKTLKTLFSQPLDFSTDNASDRDGEALESLIADLFATIAAIKAAYARLQLAQSPFDPHAIQIADNSIVSEFKRISNLKRSYLTNEISPSKPHLAQIQEQSNLINAFQINIRQLESQLHSKDSTFSSLKSKLAELESKNRALESKLYPNPHFSALNPNHFSAALRSAVKSIRSFVKILVKSMDAAGWDMDAAASSIHPTVEMKPQHRNFAFESYVCSEIFSQFAEPRSSWNPRRFFDEFNELKSLDFREILGRNVEFGDFCRERYLRLVHPKMEVAFWGNLEGRTMVRSGRGFPNSGFVNGFGEMAKRVWMLRCLFFSFGSESNGSVFQVRRGTRYSEVYMESVVDAGEDPIGGVPTVGFTVVPGFKLGSCVLQCQVYLSQSG